MQKKKNVNKDTVLIKNLNRFFQIKISQDLINYVVDSCLNSSTSCCSNSLQIFFTYTPSTENISIGKILLQQYLINIPLIIQKKQGNKKLSTRLIAIEQNKSSLPSKSHMMNYQSTSVIKKGV